MSKNIKTNQSLYSWPHLAELGLSLGHHNCDFHQTQHPRLTAMRTGLFKNFSPSFFLNHIHINLSPICIHLSSLPDYKASALLCSFLWHLECYKFNVCLHFFPFSPSLSPKELLAVAKINPATSRSKLKTGDFQSWMTQLHQEVRSGGGKKINGASMRKKQHCHPLQRDSNENTNSEQLKLSELPQGTLEENTGAGMTSSHPLLLGPCWGSRSWCQKCASEELQADQPSNSASLCVPLGVTRQVRDHHRWVWGHWTF